MWRKRSLPSKPSVYEADVHADLRGTFFKVFPAASDYQILTPTEFKVQQVNISNSLTVGAVRGVHFQLAPYTEAKLITCLSGAVFDVAVDLRRTSPNFLRYYSTRLDAKDPSTFFVPEGFGHAFQVLEAPATLVYLHSQPYVPASSGGIRPDDPLIAIDWPIQIRQVSHQDQNWPILTAAFEGLEA